MESSIKVRLKYSSGYIWFSLPKVCFREKYCTPISNRPSDYQNIKTTYYSNYNQYDFGGKLSSCLYNRPVRTLLEYSGLHRGDILVYQLMPTTNKSRFVIKQVPFDRNNVDAVQFKENFISGD